MSRGSGERFFRRSAAHRAFAHQTTAFSRGYTLSPLSRLRSTPFLLCPGNPLAAEHRPAWEESLVAAPLVSVVVEELEIS